MRRATAVPPKVSVPTALITVSEQAGEPHMRPDPVRWSVIDRLAVAGHRHATHVREHFANAATRPARHAVVVVFRQDARGLDGLRIAHRMFVDGDEVEDLSRIVIGLADRAVDYRRAGAVPLPLMVHPPREMIAKGARYLATMTSSLVVADDPAAPRRWRGLAQLLDGTQIVVRRRLDPTALVPDEAAGPDVASSRTLAVPGPLVTFGHRRAWRMLGEGLDEDLATELAALRRLHELFVDGERRVRHGRLRL